MMRRPAIDRTIANPVSIRPRDPFLSRVRTYATYKDVFGDTLSYNSLVDLVKSLPVWYWMRLASMGTLFLEHHVGEEHPQAVLAKAFLPKSLLEKPVPPDLDKYSFLFHRVQFMALFRLALLHAPLEPPTTTDEEQRKEITTRCLLGISSLLNRDQSPPFDHGRFSKKLAPDSRSQFDSGEKEFLSELMQTYHNHLGSNPNFVLGRCKDMLLDIPTDPEFSPSGVERDLLAQALLQRLGMTPSQYAALTLGIVAKYFDPTRVFKADFHFPLDRTKHFANSPIDTTVSDGFFGKVSQSRSEFLDSQVANIANGEVLDDFRSFMLKPLVHLDGSNELYPTSLTYLQHLLEGGLTWVVGGRPYDEPLRNYWGQVFEFYCRKICGRIQANSSLRPRYFGDLEYGPASRRRRTCDAIIVYGQTAVMMEFKIKMPRIKETLVDKDFNSFMDDAKQAFIGGVSGDKAVAQINATIRAIRNGDLRLPGLSPLAITRFFPVVVTLGAWPLGPFIYEAIRRQVYEAGLLRQSSYVAPVEIWSSEEFECVESVLASNAVSIGDLVRDKHVGQYGSLPLNTFLTDRYPGQLLLSPHLRCKRDEMFEIVRATLSLRQ